MGAGIISNPVARSFVHVATCSRGLLALPTLAGTASLGGSADWFNRNKVATSRHPVNRGEVTHGFLAIFVAYQLIRRNKREKEGLLGQEAASAVRDFEGRIQWKERLNYST